MKLSNLKYGDYDLAMEDLTQGDVEKFFKTIRDKYPDGDNVSGVEFQGNSVRVANELGWINPKIENVDKASPKLVRVIALDINEHLSNALDIDPS